MVVPNMGTHIPILGRLNYNVRVIARPILIEFGKKHRDANNSIEAWYWEARKAEWKNVNEVKARFEVYQDPFGMIYKNLITFAGDGKFELKIKSPEEAKEYIFDEDPKLGCRVS